MVGLLYDEHRPNFHLSDTSNTTNTQIFTTKHLLECKTDSAKGQSYHITISFSSKMLGEFRQWVVFDFGQSSKLVKKLKIRVLDIADKSQTGICQPGPLLHSQEWDWSQYQLVPFTDRPEKSRRPSYTSMKLNTSQISTKPLTKSNYKEYMQSLLNMEENQRLELLKQ